LAPAGSEPGASGGGRLTIHDRYAAFVWPAYGVTAVVFAMMLLDTFLRARGWRRRVSRLEDESGK
jgi:heme exporter protein D